jgi:hypothetical protein
VWFAEKITINTRYKVIVGVTTCIIPVIFINNVFSVALVTVFFVIFLEFVLFEYVRGCNLFSSAIPVYVVCDEIGQAHFASGLTDQYRILELILLSDEAHLQNQDNWSISELKSIKDIRKRLTKINIFSFFPTPRRIMYFISKNNKDTLKQLLELSLEFSIPLFKISEEASERLSLHCSVSVMPISISDFENVTLRSQEKTALASVLKSKRVWIFYDGRQTILDLICAISSVTLIDLTVLCESEALTYEIAEELSKVSSSKNYKIKIASDNIMDLQEIKPDILFYNMPMKSVSSGEDDLKEALIKNVLDTQRIIEFAQQSRIKFVFIMSTMEALNANNWVGATQRLGELLAQYADSNCKKMYSKFRVIRIPECITDRSGIFKRMISSVQSSGSISFSLSEAEVKRYCREDILMPLIKMIIFALKEHDFFSSVYSIIPRNNIAIDDLIKIICNTFLLRNGEDIKIVHSDKSEVINLENFPNISEPLEHTSIDCVMCTKLSSINREMFEAQKLSIEQLKSMTTRELIASVFQSLGAVNKFIN